MPQFDIKALLSRLDPGSMAYLDAASKFCTRQHHSSVAPEHVLMQMLDHRDNPLNRSLESCDISPVDWIKQLLARTEQYKTDRAQTPVFSERLLSWFQFSTEDLMPEQSITLHALLTALIKYKHTLKLGQLASIENLQPDHISPLTGNAPDTATPPAALPSVAEEDDDKTTIMTEQEIAASIENAALSSAPQTDDNDKTVLMSEENVAASIRQATANSAHSNISVPGYSDFRKIGEGGMASVYRARHIGLDRDVALKVLKIEPGSDEDFVERFLREARIVAKLAHPSIIQIYDINQTDDLTYIAMEYVPGGELSDRMGNDFKLEEIIAILTQVLSALQSAHDKGYIHRDIKPANILFRQDESVVLTDFGIARAMAEDNGLTIAGSILGTPRYMSPEQGQGMALDHRSDLYSVGVLFFHMLEGKLPYLGDSAMGTVIKHIMDPIPELSSKWSRCQPFIERAMAKNTDDRFQSGREMILALTQLENN